MFHKSRIVALVTLLFLISCNKEPKSVITPEKYLTDSTSLFDASQDNDDVLIDLMERLKGRVITKIVLHCAAIPEGMDPDKDWYDRVWELNGWKNPGYHALVKLGGDIIWMSTFNSATNGVKGMNSESIHISYSGGLDKYTNKPKDTQTKEQEKVTKALVEALLEIYPDVEVYGHTELNPGKACPSYDVATKFPHFKRKCKDE